MKYVLLMCISPLVVINLLDLNAQMQRLLALMYKCNVSYRQKNALLNTLIHK